MSVAKATPTVLFVCTGNQYRSPVAAACLKRLLAQRGRKGWVIESAGTWTAPRQLPIKDATEAARLLGLDLSSHLTRVVDQPSLEESDLILVMEHGHSEALRIEFPDAAPRTYLLSEMVPGIPFDIPDPLGVPRERIEILRAMCDVIERGLPRIMELAAASFGSRG